MADEEDEYDSPPSPNASSDGERQSSPPPEPEPQPQLPRIDIPPAVEVFYPSSQACLERWQFLPRSEFQVEYQRLSSSWKVRVSLRRWNQHYLLRYQLKIQTREQRSRSSLIWFGLLNSPDFPLYQRRKHSDRPATPPPPPPPLRDAFIWSLRRRERDGVFLHGDYQCAHADCEARKTVKRSDSGHHITIIYHDNHTHDAPPLQSQWRR